MKKIYLMILIVGFMLFLIDQESSGFGYKTWGGIPITWPNDNAVLSLHPVSFPSGHTWNLWAQYSMSDWNSIAGSNFKFYYNEVSHDHTNHNDGYNTVVWMPGSSFDPGVLGVTFVTYNGSSLKDTDVWFNADESWASGHPTSYTESNPKRFRIVASHEFGHALGLSHYSGCPARMNPFYPGGGWPSVWGNYDEFWCSLFCDDNAGMRFLYSGGGTSTDLVAHSWKNAGSHCTNTTNANPGDTLTLEYSVENLGNTSQNQVRLGFYLSTNNQITSSDRYLGNTYFNFPPTSRGTYTSNFTLPSDVSAGTYYLGAILDDQESISEDAEWNNRTPAVNKLTVIVNDDPYEENDTFYTAAHISPGTYQGLQCLDDDYFKLYLDVNDYLSFMIYFSNASGDLDLKLLAPDGSLVDLSESTGNSESVEVFKASQSGYYRGYIYGFSGATNGYTMEVQFKEAPSPLVSDTYELSAGTGGTVNLSLDATFSNAYRNYLIIGSVTGTQPGIPLPGGLVTLPVNWDWFSDLEMTMLNSYFFNNFAGSLDAQGMGNAQLNLPPVPGATGITMYFAYCCNNPFDFVSNFVSIEIAP